MQGALELAQELIRRRSVTPEDAGCQEFLASPLAEFITGEILAVNGGSSAGRAFLPLSTPPAGRF